MNGNFVFFEKIFKRADVIVMLMSYENRVDFVNAFADFGERVAKRTRAFSCVDEDFGFVGFD